MFNEEFPELSSRELPPRYGLYSRVFELTQKAINYYYENSPVDAEFLSPKGPDETSLVGFIERKYTPVPLELSPMESDSAELIHMSYSLGGSHSPRYDNNSQNHHGVMIGLALFKNGTPYTAEGDNFEDDEDRKYYDVVVPREGRPFIAQSQMESGGDWNELNKRPLTDQDCVSLYEFLETKSKHPTNVVGCI